MRSNQIERLMHTGPLVKAVILSCAMAAGSAAQAQASAPTPGKEGQGQIPQSQFSPASPAQTPTAPAATSQAPQLQVPALIPLPLNANDYVRQALEHELAEQDRDHTHWRYNYHREDEKNNSDRDVIETSQGSLARTLLLWGKPLTPQQRQQDEERMHKLVTDPQERAQRAKRERDDDEKVHKMLRAIPQAFIFKYDGEENGLVRLSFSPAQHFDPPSMELRIFRSLTGHLWVDRASNRLAGVDGTLVEDVNFGFGILGRLYKGGTFRVEQKEIGEGHWAVVSEEVNMIGRAVLFKTITRKQKETLTNFCRVPDTLTMSEALEMLEKEPGAVSAATPRAALQPQGKN